MHVLVKTFRPFARTLPLLLAVAAGTIALVRFAPGFYSDEREMDGKYADGARAELAEEQAHPQSLTTLYASQLSGLLHGDLGLSRQYKVPVAEVISGRIGVSASLLVRSILGGWLLALAAALPLSALGRSGHRWGLPFTLLLATPTAALATACILLEAGGPALVLTLLIAARDFKFLSGVLREAWSSPHLIQGRAQGFQLHRLVLVHILPNVAPRLKALATLSIVTGLAALIPTEVLFNVPGLGQLAWSAVMNRDLPVLVAVCMLMAIVVALAGMVSGSETHGQPVEAGA